MFKFVVVLALSVACVSATPGVVSAPYVNQVGPAVVTAHSSQVIARNYNGLAAPLVAAAPYVAAPVAAPFVKAAPYFASPYVAAPVVKAAPFVAAPAVVKSAPLVASPALAHYASPFAHYHAASVAAPYVASPYVAAPVVKAAPFVAAPGVVKSTPLVASPALAHYASPFAHYHVAPAYYL